MKAAFYLRVSTLDQHPESQLQDLLALARQRNWQVVEQYVDRGVSGARTRRPALDRMMEDAARARFDVIVVWAADRLARSVKDFLHLLDEFQRLGVVFVSLRENIDTQGAVGKALMTIISVIAELERGLIRERVLAGMRRARLEGKRLGRRPLDLDHEGIIRDRARGRSLAELAKLYRTSRSTIRRVLAGVPKGVSPSPLQTQENRRPETAA